jgi:hypothetical protein
MSCISLTLIGAVIGAIAGTVINVVHNGVGDWYAEAAGYAVPRVLAGALIGFASGRSPCPKKP